VDYGKLLSRSFEITRKYRALWLFGVLLAIFGGGGNSGNVSNLVSLGRDGGGRGSGSGALPTLPSSFWEVVAIFVFALVCLLLVWIILSIVLRFVSRGALIGLVQELEAVGATPTVRRGFSIGGSRFWQLLGIALTINVPLLIVSLATLVVTVLPAISAIVPMIAARRSPEQIGGALVGGILGSVLLLCCAGIFLWIVTLVLRPFYEFFVRECVIQRRGVFDSIREGYRLVRANLGNVAMLYLLIIGIGIGYGMGMFVVGLILIGIPVAVGVAVGAIANSVGAGIVVGLVIGLPMLLILLFISGLYQVFESTLWTEGYLAITAPKTPGVAL
jgi:hypothetical protein